MTNMSYCMFENTKNAIRQINNALYDNEVDPEEMSVHERGAFYSIIEEAESLIENMQGLMDQIEDNQIIRHAHIPGQFMGMVNSQIIKENEDDNIYKRG